MPTPKERNALIFLAALGAIGIGARAFRSTTASTSKAAADSRGALERQIGSVDSAKTAKTAKTSKRSRATAIGLRAKGGQKNVIHDTKAATSADSAPLDPLAKYEARRLEVARQNQAAQERMDRDRAELPTAPDTAGSRGPRRRKKPAKIRPLFQGDFCP